MNKIDFGNKYKSVRDNMIDLERFQAFLDEFQYLIDMFDDCVIKADKDYIKSYMRKLNKMQQKGYSKDRIEQYRKHRQHRLNRHMFNNWKNEWYVTIQNFMRETLVQRTLDNTLPFIDFDKTDYYLINETDDAMYHMRESYEKYV